MIGPKEAIEAVDYYIDQFRTKTGIVIPKPIIKFDLRGVVSGKAWINKNLLQFNPILLSENPEVFVKQTVLHEVVHLGAFFKYGSRIDPHGQQWKNLMIIMGGRPVRCHNYDVSVASGLKSKPLFHEVL